MSATTPPGTGFEGRVIRSLFDLKFERFATPALIRLVYTVTLVIVTLVAGVALLISVAGGFFGGAEGSVAMVVGVVVIPPVWLVVVIYARVVLETVMVLFRIADNTRPAPSAPTASRGTPGGAPTGPTGPASHPQTAQRPSGPVWE